MSSIPILTPEQCDALLKCEDDDAPLLLARYYAASLGEEHQRSEYEASFLGFWSLIRGFIKNSGVALHKAVCVDFDACAKKRVLDNATFQRALEKVLNPFILRWAKKIGGFALRSFAAFAVYYFVNWGIDELCDCA
jgi:hypothetical protein